MFPLYSEYPYILKTGERTTLGEIIGSGSVVSEFQFTSMPDAGESYSNKVVQYIGSTTLTYTKGAWYKCELVNGVYTWKIFDISGEQSLSSAKNYSDTMVIDTDRITPADGFSILYDIDHTTVDSWLSSYITFSNGILTEKAHPTGNIGAHYKLTDAAFAEYDLRFKMQVHLISVSGEWSARLEYKRASNGQTAVYQIPFGTITENGTRYFEIDLAYMAAHQDYDGTGIDFRIMNASHGANDTVVIDVINTLVGSDLKLVGDDLTEILTNMDNEVGELSIDVTTMKSTGVVLTAPNGYKYKLLVANDGTLSTALNYPDNILYIGNSLLVGFGTHGMASTTVEDDYYAKVNDFIEDKGITLTTDKVAGSGFEECTNDTEATTWITTNLAAKMSSSVKQIIVQLGDNVNTVQRKEQFPSSMRILFDYLKLNCPNAKIAWVGCWYASSSIDDILIPVCREYVIPFVALGDLYFDTDNRSYIGATYIDANGDEQTITTAGQASHPSDLGFTRIANLICEKIF